MPARFVSIDHDTPMLLPPDLRDWVPGDHRVLKTARINHAGTGSEQYPPSMMLGLLIYCYASGTFSSGASRPVRRGGAPPGTRELRGRIKKFIRPHHTVSAVCSLRRKSPIQNSEVPFFDSTLAGGRGSGGSKTISRKASAGNRTFPTTTL
jgi:hypothetical protein